jgi:tetratricopeptide (TPR) repeat protein
MSGLGRLGSQRPRPPDRAVRSGPLPPLAPAYVARQETGLRPGLYPGHTIVLAPAGEEAAVRAGAGWPGQPPWEAGRQGLRGRAAGAPGADTSGGYPPALASSGTGKTQLAAALARAHAETGAVHLVAWIPATGRDAVLAGYAQALADLTGQEPAEGPEQAAARFLEWLGQAGRPWLVVLDDLADPAALDGLWPRGPSGQVIVTTPQPQAAAQANRPRLVPVGPFSAREALGYLSGRLAEDPDQRVGGLDLAIELGLLPLALGLAASVISLTGVDCRAYRARLAEHKPAAAASPDPYAAIMAAAWSLSVAVADQLPPAGLASRVLTLVSVLGPHGIPGDLLTGEAACAYLSTAAGGFGVDAAQVRAAARNLARAGLVAIDGGNPDRTVLAHPLVQAVCRHHRTPAQTEQAARAAADALAELWSRGERSPATAQALRDCTAALHEVAGPVLWSPECHQALLLAGQSLDDGGLAGPAVGYWQAMLDASTRHLGPSHAQTLAVRASLAHAYRQAGRPEDAIALAERTLAEYERALGSRHRRTVAARVRLAEVYGAAGRHKEAIAQGKRALADSESGGGQGGPDTVAVRASLAEIYRVAGRVKDAIALGKRALADFERVRGPDHPETITARANLASSYLSARKLAYAIKEYERALADFERVLGPGHRLTQVTRENLEEAAACARSALGIDLRSPRP